MRAPGVVAVSMVVQLVGVVLAGALVLLAGASDASADTGRLFFSLVVAFAAVSFAGAFLAARKCGTGGALPALAMAGPVAFVLLTALFRAAELGARYLFPQLVLPLLAGGAGVVVARRAAGVRS